jgi:hypothetical protein
VIVRCWVRSCVAASTCSAVWNANAKPFVWTATADEILAKVRITQTNIKRLVDNNAK